MSGESNRRPCAVSKLRPNTLALAATERPHVIDPDDQGGTAFAVRDGSTLLVPPFGVPLAALPTRKGVQLEHGRPVQHATLVKVRVNE